MLSVPLRRVHSPHPKLAKLAKWTNWNRKLYQECFRGGRMPLIKRWWTFSLGFVRHLWQKLRNQLFRTLELGRRRYMILVYLNLLQYKNIIQHLLRSCRDLQIEIYKIISQRSKENLTNNIKSAITKAKRNNL